jgi:hypothetical protein
MTASGAEKARGGGALDRLQAGLGSFGRSIGKSTVQGGANILDKGIDAAANAPQSAKGLGQLMNYGMNPSSPLSGEAIGLGSDRGRVERNEKNDERSSKDTPEDKLTNGERLMQSRNISDRVQGIGEMYNEKRYLGGGYSGLSGRFKALRSSIGEFHKANKKAAPGFEDSNQEGKQ